MLKKTIKGVVLALILFVITLGLYTNHMKSQDPDWNLQVGDYKLSVVKYKLFCDFDGHLIRRNRCKIFNMSWCSPMEAKLEKVLQRSSKDNPKEYASFVKLLEKCQEMKGWE